MWYARAAMRRYTLDYRDRQAGLVAFARWRDSKRREHTQKLGVAWVERHGAGWRNRSGKRPDGALTISDAHARARELVEAQEEKLKTAVDNATADFKTVAEAWFTHGRDVAGWAPGTVRNRRYTLDAHLIPAFGKRPVRSLDRAEVRRWWRGLHNAKRNDTRSNERTRKDGRLSDRNANQLLTDLRAILNWAHDDYGLADNAADGIAKHREHNNERPSFYTVEQVEALVRAAASPSDALAYRIAAYAGLRRGEVVSLRWRCVDFTRGSLHINESVSDGHDGPTKSGKGRTVPLAPQLAQALAQARPDEASDDDLVIPGVTPGYKLDGSMLRKRFVAARVKAKLPPLRFHDLRHTFGSLAVDGGASLVQVQAWLGHADLQTTARYLHTASRTTDAELLGRAFTADSADELVAASSRE